MIKVNQRLSIDERALDFSFIRSSGPGGQNVNKVSTRAQLRVSLKALNLPADAEQRLRHLAANRINRDNELIIEAGRFRTQPANRRDAIQRLVALIARALKSPKPRRATRRPQASIEKRLEQKRRLAVIKQSRSKPLTDD